MISDKTIRELVSRMIPIGCGRATEVTPGDIPGIRRVTVSVLPNGSLENTAYSFEFAALDTTATVLDSIRDMHRTIADDFWKNISAKYYK